MPQFRVLKRSTRERIYVDKINPREHLHISGAEFSASMIKDISDRNGSNTFKSEESKPRVEDTQKEPEPVKVTPKKGRPSKK